MCGIIGGVANKDITPLLLDGLKRLEYRGYDSSGLSVLSKKNTFERARSVGKVANLANNLEVRVNKISGKIGIAHTRWATHGVPSVDNAHPHISMDCVSLVHNGIIENFEELRNQLSKNGYIFTSQTDSEVIAHAIDYAMKSCNSFVRSVQLAVEDFSGSFGLGIISSKYPDQMIAVRKGSPLVIGLGKDANYIASDQVALLSVTQKFIFLEEGDIAEIKIDNITIYDSDCNVVNRPIKISKLRLGESDLGDYDHFMQKEIFEQPQAIRDTLESRIANDSVVISAFGKEAREIFYKTKQIQIIACGSSFNAGLVAQYWLEDIAKISCNVEVASEYRYRRPVILNHTLFVFLSQSGETADTVEALKIAKQTKNKIYTLSITNTPESSLTRLSDLTFLTHAGLEIGVASTKAFTTQLVALALLTCSFGKIKKTVNQVQEKGIISGFKRLPGLVNDALMQEKQIKKLAKRFKDKKSTLFLGRGFYALILNP